jgi:hypothetical protein
MEWQKPQVKSFNEEDLLKELQVKAGCSGSGGGYDRKHYHHDHHD